MIDIYVDLESKNYDQLLEDGGETVFCAAMKIIFEVDVCGLLSDLEALPADVSAALGSAANDFVCGFNIGGIQCGGGSIAWGTLPIGYVCAYTPGQYIPPIDQASAQLQAQVNAALVIPPDQPQPSYCQSQICQPGTEICGAPGSNGQCYCSNCPLGQALQNGVCNICAPKTGSDLTQSSDQRSWTQTSWSDTYAPSFDGSHCLETGGSSNVKNYPPCPLEQISPEPGKCVMACPFGQITDQNTGMCVSCPNGSIASYLHEGTSSIGTCSVCPYGMQSKDHGSICACPTGQVQASPTSMCGMCPANTYQDFAICSPCPSDEMSEPGSTSCKKIECPNGATPFDHACPLKVQIAPTLPGGIGGPAVIDRSCVAGTHMEHGHCAPDGFLSSQPPPLQSPGAAQNPCPPLSRWTGGVCIGPRGKHFCPEGLTMRDDICVRGDGALVKPGGEQMTAPHGECPVFSHWNGATCIGPRGRAFCPADMRMQNGVCAP
jgi:hypothetical protein